MKTPIEGAEAHPFNDLFENVEDSRNQDYIHHPLAEILFLLVVGTLSGCDELTVIEVFGQEKLSWLRKYYPYKYGIASHDTLGRVLSMINRRKFEMVFAGWATAHFGLDENALIHIDGKRLKGSADKADQSKKKGEGGKYVDIIVNVYASGAGILLAQNNVSDKMDEINGALELLDWLDLSGCSITGDANFCRTAIIEKILQQKADYILTLKGNWPNQFEYAQNIFADEEIEKESFQTEETGHGRYEKRSYRSITKGDLPPEMIQQFSQLQQVIEVNRSRVIQSTGKTENETHYYITSLNTEIKKVADMIRRHWSIENQLHYVLDVSFNEDASRIRTGNAASNQSLIRKTSLNILRASKLKGSIKAQRLKCAISDANRENVLKNIAMR
jgi:predicted transposase YbfD/YdcC